MGRRRIDQLVTEAGLVDSREKAKRLILAGVVLVNEVPVDKPGTLVDETAILRLRGEANRYVGRGGDKLAGAIRDFGLTIEGIRALDVGASTGGFTDCLLQHGALRVVALDVGAGQLHWKLVSDSRVRRVERVNARYLKPRDLDSESFELVTVDVAFISLSKILPALSGLIDKDTDGFVVVALVKPQFELSAEEVGKGGIVRDPILHEKAIRSVCESAGSSDFATLAITPSPITGMEGNREFFVLLRPNVGQHFVAPTSEALSGTALLRRIHQVCEKGTAASDSHAVDTER